MAEPLRHGGELDAIGAIAAMIDDAPEGEVWLGDDAAVLHVGAETLLFATDTIVEGVHFTRELASLEDVGFKAMSVNVSDIAAMGGAPRACVVALSGASTADLEPLYAGLAAGARRYGCPLVGGDLSQGGELVLTVSVLGRLSSAPVLRSGARPGDVVYVTGPLGASSAGLKALLADDSASGSHVDCYRRPLARTAEAIAAASAGASAMIDLSDGLCLDLTRLLDASKVGVEIGEVPIAEHADEADALGGGEDYELLFCAASPEAVKTAFSKVGLAPPYAIGAILSEEKSRVLLGEPLLSLGYEHRLG